MYCTDYVLVHSSVKEKFLETAIKEIEKSEYCVKNGNMFRLLIIATSGG